MSDLSSEIWILALLITLLAGFIKGAVGFAMPLIMVSGLSSILPPHLAVAGVILPIVVSNLTQTFRAGAGPAAQAVRDFWRYILIVCAAILVFAQFLPGMEPATFYLILGIPVVVLSLIQVAGVRMSIAPAQRWWVEWVVGLVSGMMGGLAGTWGPTTVLYLLAIDTPKARQMVVQGVIYGLGSIALLLAHIQSGILNGGTVQFSAILLVPALAGQWVGFRIQDRLDPVLFRRLTLIVLVATGLNLVRRGLAG